MDATDRRHTAFAVSSTRKLFSAVQSGSNDAQPPNSIFANLTDRW
jgi:hypothetical protein